MRSKQPRAWQVAVSLAAALILILTGTFSLRSVAGSRLHDADRMLTDGLIIGEGSTPLLATEGCVGSPDAIVPFGIDEPSELQKARPVLDSFLLSAAVARLSLIPRASGSSSGKRFTLADLRLRKDLTVNLQLEDDRWCFDTVVLAYAVVQPDGSVVDDSIQELVERGSNPDAVGGDIPASALQHAIDCRCLTSQEQEFLEDLRTTIAWAQFEQR